jgi:hypothetical protein
MNKRMQFVENYKAFWRRFIFLKMEAAVLLKRQLTFAKLLGFIFQKIKLF